MLEKFLAAALLASPFLSAPAAAADGAPDPSFGNGGFAYLALDGVEGHELRTGAVVALADGKLLFAGSRNKLIQGNPDPHTRASLERMNADGSADTSFGSNAAIPGILVLGDLVPGTGIQQIEDVQVLADGSIVAAGSAFAFGPATSFIVKLGADGTPDATFGNAGLVTIANSYCHALGIDSQGRLVVAGEMQAGGAPSVAYVARFGADGTPDTGFGSTGDGIVRLHPADTTEAATFATLAIGPADAIVAGGTFEAYGSGLGTDFSLARLDASGALDTSFSGGWRTFPMPGSASTFNGVDRLRVLGDGRVVFAGHYQDGDGNIQAALARTLVDGSADLAFGDAATQGFAALAIAPGAFTRYPTTLLRQPDGKLLVSISYSASDKENYLALRTSPEGALDASFGTGGVVDLDPAPSGVYSDLTAMTLQDGKPILAGATKRDSSSSLVDLGVVRLTGGVDDRIFADGFEGSAPSLSTYDDLAEGFAGTAFTYNGVAYSDANGVGGVFPDGSTFTPDDVGDQFVIEDAAIFYPDFPNYGSAPNALTFGTSFIPGDNLSLGAFVRATLTPAQPVQAASMDIAYYEGGPWGGIELHMDAYLGGAAVDTDVLTIATGGERDNVTTGALSVKAARFDSIRIYATWQGQPTAPRLMVDNLRLTAAAP